MHFLREPYYWHTISPQRHHKMMYCLHIDRFIHVAYELLQPSSSLHGFSTQEMFTTAFTSGWNEDRHYKLCFVQQFYFDSKPHNGRINGRRGRFGQCRPRPRHPSRDPWLKTEAGCRLQCKDVPSESCGCADNYCPNDVEKVNGAEHKRRWAVYRIW